MRAAIMGFLLGIAALPALNGVLSTPTIHGVEAIDALKSMVAPSIQTCPVGNCPTTPGSGSGGGGGPILSAQWMSGSTALGASVGEWESSINLYIGTGAAVGSSAGAKVTQYLGAMQGPGGGSGWTLNSNIIRGACPGGANSLYGLAGSGIPFGVSGCGTAPGSLGLHDTTIGYELDLTNWDQDGGSGGPLIYGMLINTNSAYRSTAGIAFATSSGQLMPSWQDGIQFNGPINGLPARTVSDNTVVDNSGSDNGYHAAGVHAQSVLRDDSTGVYGLTLLGTKTTSNVNIASASPIAQSVSGNHSVAATQDTSVTPAAVNLAGTYSLAAITTQTATTPIAINAVAGQSVCLNNTKNCFSYSAANHKTYLTDAAGVVVMSVADTTGNVIIKGTLTQSGTP